MTVNSDGNVGIGTTNATAKLNIQDSSTTNFIASRFSNASDANNTTKSVSINFASRDTGGTFKDVSVITSFVQGVNAIDGGMSFSSRASDTITEKMRITGVGDVGIGTTSPRVINFGTELTVSGVGKAQPAGFVNIHGSRTTDDSVGAFTFHNTVDGTRYFLGGIDGVRFGANNSGRLSFSTVNAGTFGVRMVINPSGEVLIAGTTDQGAYNLQVNGTGVWGAGAYVNGSDRRLKTNINAIETGLDVIEKLNPVTFNYIEEYSKDKTLQTGFIAQEMLEAMSEKDYVDSIVQKGKEFYGVAYQSLIPILVKAVQELTKRIKELESK
jgi:hypothetical protein